MSEELVLNQSLVDAIVEMGFEGATPVQEKVIPLATANKDLIVSAATGSGKTAAYLLPSFNKLIEYPKTTEGVRILVLVPTRELAQQVEQEANKIAKFTDFKALSLIGGGSEFKVQEKALSQHPELVVATPGRLIAHLENKSFSLEDLDVLVLDEVDRMLDMGFADQVQQVVELSNKGRQSMVFSATLPRSVAALAKEILIDPQKIIIDHTKKQHEGIRQCIALADNEHHKDQLTQWLLTNERFHKAIVFTNSKAQANRLCGVLRYHKLRASVMHGDVSQEARESTLEGFKKGKNNIMVATELAARGMDVPGIDLVINFDMARKGDDYVHRIGRTGRAGEQGLAVSLICQHEWNLMASIERYLKVKFERKFIKELAGTYKGPKKLKNSGKAASTKKKKAKKSKAPTKARSKSASKPGARKGPRPANKPKS